MKRVRMATPLDMIEAHLTWMRAGRYAANTIRDAGKLLHRLHRELPAGLHQALPEELAAWLGGGAWSAQTAATYYKHIVRFYRWATAARDPWLSYDPSTELRRPTARLGLPRPAADNVVQYAIYEMPEPWRLACRLTALAGLRPCEVAAVRREDVTERTITIKGKGGRVRSIPTHPLIWETVWSRPPGPLITRPGGAPATPEYVSKAGAYALRRAGLGITLYQLRHWFGTEIQARHRDLRVTQELMGHSSPVTTQVYTLVTDQRLREAVAALPFTGGAGGIEVAPRSGTSPEAPGVAALPLRPRSAVAGRRAGGRVLVSRSRRRDRP